MNNLVVESVMDAVHNWFSRGCLYGEFEVRDGAIGCPSLLDGQFYRIVGSALNDGLHRRGDRDLADEKFDGKVYPLAVPPAFLEMCSEIEEWREKNAAALEGPYSSESFGGYSYSKAETSDGAPLSWKEAFASRLQRWRKLS